MNLKKSCELQKRKNEKKKEAIKTKNERRRRRRKKAEQKEGKNTKPEKPAWKREGRFQNHCWEGHGLDRTI